MVELICGSAGTGKGAYIIEKIRQSLNSGRRLILLVPEQEAVIWEGRVCRELPPLAGALLEVVSFRRLADAVSRTEGAVTYTVAKDGKKLLLMWSALLSVKDSLSVYGKGDGYEDKYALHMLETVGELRKNRITPAMLESAAARLREDDFSLSQRLCDVAAVYSAYMDLYNNDGESDSDGILESLCETLRTRDFFHGADVFVDSFYSLTPAETEILYYIIRGADNTYITFDFDRSCRQMHFEHVRDFYKKVCFLCDRAAKDKNTVDLKDNKRTENPSLKYLDKNLWDFTAKVCETKNGISAVYTEDRYEEARAVSSLIERFVHEGARYSDIAVIAGDMENLRGILDTRLDSVGIPYHLSERREIKNSPAVKLILSLLACISSGCRREYLIECLKTGLCPLSDRECSDFEEYTETWNLHGKKAFIDTELWSMNPAGYTSRTDSRGKTVLLDANRVKSVLAGELKKLYGVVDTGSGTIRDLSEAICEILEDFNVYGSLKKEAERLKENGRKSEADVEEKVYSLILTALDIMVETVGDVRIDSARFSRLFGAVVSSLDTGTIPAGVDMVTLGSAKGIRVSEVRHVILVGCVEGEFPSSGSGNDFFTDFEKVSLEKVGINLEDTSEKRLGEELFRFWRACTLPSETLTVIIPKNGERGVLYPSTGAKRILKLFDITPYSFGDVAQRELVWSVKGANEALPILEESARRNLLSLRGEFPEIKDDSLRNTALGAEADFIDEEAKKLIYRDIINLTQSRIDKFSSCRFAYYINYILGIKEPATASVNTADAGTFIHGILESFFSETREREYPIDDGEAEEIVSRITENYIKESLGEAILSSRVKYLFMRLRRNAVMLVKLIMRELANSDFRPYKFELSIGKEGGPEPLVFDTGDGVSAALYGNIDRVDVAEKESDVYVKVVDYKTGTKVFKLDDIDKGMNLQLMIYLFSLWKDGGSFAEEFRKQGKRIIPAGMVYCATATDAVKSDIPISNGESLAEKAVTVSGMMLEDFFDKDNKKILSATVEEFEELYRKIQDTVISISNEMKGGECGSIPAVNGQKTPCAYCSYRPICRHVEREEESHE